MCYVRNNLKQHATHFDKNYVVVVFCLPQLHNFSSASFFYQIPIWFTFLVQWRYLLHYFKMSMFLSVFLGFTWFLFLGWTLLRGFASSNGTAAMIIVFFIIIIIIIITSSSSSSRSSCWSVALHYMAVAFMGYTMLKDGNDLGNDAKWCKVAATKPALQKGERQQDNKIRKKKQKWKNQNCDFSIILFSSCDRAVTSTCMHLPCECATRPSAAIEVLASPGTRVRQVPCTATDMEQVPHAVRFVDPIHPMGRHLTNDNQVVLPCCIA